MGAALRTIRLIQIECWCVGIYVWLEKWLPPSHINAKALYAISSLNHLVARFCSPKDTVFHPSGVAAKPGDR